MKCRDCGRALAHGERDGAAGEADEVYPLTCGHAFCRACLASYARSSLLAHQLIPLRCCQRHVPLEWIAAVVDPPEAAYYHYLADKVALSTRTTHSGGTAKTTTQAATTPAIRWLLALRSSLSAAADGGHFLATTESSTVRCDGCSCSTTDEALGCGHVYCRQCLAEFYRAAMDFSIDIPPPCCAQHISLFNEERWKRLLGVSRLESVALARSNGGGRSEASMIVIDDDEQHPSSASAKDSSRRSSKRVRENRAKAMRVEANGDAEAINLVAAPTEPIIVDDSGAGGGGGGGGEEDGAQRCFTCSKVVAVTTDAACGHSFCLKCIGDRCRQAVKNDKDGGIGFPLRCCEMLLPLETVRPALSKQSYGQYKLLVGKRESDLKQLAKRKRGVGKQKASTTKKPARVSLTAVISSNGAASQREFRLASASDALERQASESLECVACLSQIDADTQQQFRGPCGHVYCTDCLGMMAKTSLEDRSLVPIRCCGKELPAEYIARVLPKRSLNTYNRFVQEKDWKTSNLQSDKEYAKLVKTLGGKQCPKCGIGVQKISGCNAMACSRGHRFCWACVSDPCVCLYPIQHH